MILIDTAGPTVAVAAFVDGACVWSGAQTIVAGADGWLTPALGEAMRLLRGLDRVAVVVGPGAFTGLRVGVAQALGLAFARGVPLRAVPSLALRAAAGGESARTLAVIDARKGRLYVQRFRVVDGLPEAEAPAEDLAPEAAALLAEGGAVVVGEGAHLVPLQAGAVVPPLAADAYVRAGWALCASLPDVDAGSLTPFYLREPDARPSG